MASSFISAHDLFRRLAGSDLPEWPALERTISRRRLKRGEALFLAGERQPFVFVVNAGIVKMTYETPDGDAWVKGFAEAGMCFASLTALDEGGVASYSAYAEVESSIDRVDYRMLQQLAGRHLAWQRAIGNAFKFYGRRKEQREMELLTRSPEDRYLGFLRAYPELATTIRQRDIASYVRITPVALSRIKSRLRAKGVIA